MSTLPPNPPQIRSHALAWLSAAAVAIAALATVAYLKTCESSKALGTKAVEATKEVKEAVQELGGLAAKFKTGTISHTFAETIPQITPTHGDVLELATVRCQESFKQTDSMTGLWGLLPMGTTVSEIRVPVTFRYHLRLSDQWRLASKDKVCVVLAPAIRASLPPAIHTDAMEKSTANGWLRWSKDENLAELEGKLTPRLTTRASDADHQRAVREACRQSVRDFVINWLLREEQWRQDRFTSVIVLFPDEVAVGSDDDLERYACDPRKKL
jgi:hypothetical protein